uniref:Peptidase C1A papain C-terminal domain-containing protein n=1 Tax=Favella ehrenbergii TaxID=182087 RepID=A0A7S3I6F2_9SPIT
MVAFAAFAHADSQMLHPVREEIVEEIKLKAGSWKPKEVHNNKMRHRSPESIKRSMGHLGVAPSVFPTDFLKTMAGTAGNFFKQVASSVGLDSLKNEHFRLKQKSGDEADKKNKKEKKDSKAKGDKEGDEEESAEPEVFVDDGSTPPDNGLPMQFSWREKRPVCLGKIQDQGECGSCWAFTSAGLLSDRFCIHTDGAVDVRLSPQEMVNCNYENYGCSGGYLVTSVDYLMVEGGVPEECVPYVDGGNVCSYRCSDSGFTAYDKYYCKPGTLAIAVTYDEIKRELMNNGPMLMGLQIMEDFLNYEEGIYKHVVGEVVGGHAMKLIGWGYDDEEGLYWELQNQWTVDWGEAGYVRIKHGEIGIDSLGIACMPDLI